MGFTLSMWPREVSRFTLHSKIGLPKKVEYYPWVGLLAGSPGRYPRMDFTRVSGHRRGCNDASAVERGFMSGIFEILTAGEQSFRFRLKADDGTVVAVSPKFPDIAALVAGINAVRENAATGFVVDRRSLGA
ncbi:YegP family protein [Arthrobacter sp. M-10]|uniref:YegP family protein n=1 Tax=Arthrobacter sp. M-10 TaxID=3233037 RepID=UPI003F8E6780